MRTALLTSLMLLTLLTGCSTGTPAADADVLVIGAGIAGLSAALEAEAGGASVLLVDANSVGGGHAVKAGGFALVGTPLQAARGYQDDPEIAFQDLMAWGEDADAGWVRRYVEASGPEVHDWLAGFGVRFAFILETAQHSVPRFHFTRGAALNVVVPLLDAALGRERIAFLWHHEAVELLRTDGQISGARVRNLRSGAERELRAAAVIVATGGAQGNLAAVLASWRDDLPAPEQLYVGGGALALGSGHRLASGAGGAVAGLHRQTIFTSGIPDPRDPDGLRGMLTQNPAAIWVNAEGQRFINESGPSKLADETILALRPATHWLIFDEAGLAELRIRDAVWLNPETLADEVLGNPALVSRGESLAELARAAGLPPAALEASVARYNQQLENGTDEDFARFSSAAPDPSARPVASPPFYAIQRFPLTRKSMGGIVVDEQTRVLDEDGQVLSGLYAAGEVTGVAGINGSHGGEGTFLGPSVYMGRLAGRHAAAELELSSVALAGDPSTSAPAGEARMLDEAALQSLLTSARPGYWHFGEVHEVVLERAAACTDCHSAEWPTAAAAARSQQRAQLASCINCH